MSETKILGELLDEFLAETADNFSALDNDLLALERTPGDAAILQRVFRVVHTIKGTSGFIGLLRLGRLTHALENVLSELRDGKRAADPDTVSLVLRSIDRVRVIVNGLSESRSEPAGEDADLVAELKAWVDGAGGAVQAGPAAVGTSPAPAPDAPIRTEVTDPPARSAPDAAAASGTPAEQPIAKDAAGPQSIRVNLATLESLINLAGELVLTRNQLLQVHRQRSETDYAAPIQQLDYVTTLLQDIAMRTRMQPIGNAFAALPRVIRDLARDLGKKVDVSMSGGDTELDRQVLELIRDPLVHMVRNAVDHGIEMPQDRLHAGKPETGRITLAARQEGGQIVIEIADDGKGIDAEKVRRKALTTGAATAAEIDAMDSARVLQLIFRAGLSTAERVTSVSGRGVGMDVVKTNVEKIGGTVEIQSRPQKGSVFRVRIPLTLAIVSSLIVACGSHRFAVARSNIVELVKPMRDRDPRLETINGVGVLRLRDRLLPVVELRQVLAIGERDAGDDGIVLVIRAGGESCGLLVDAVVDTEEIVVKPVSGVLRSLPHYAGSTILGDGSAVLIIDAVSIVGQAGKVRENVNDEVALIKRGAETADQWVLTETGAGRRKMVPLRLIERLEMIEGSRIEIADGRPVVQYRGTLVPVHPIDANGEVKPGQRLALLVVEHDGRKLGIAVERIMDIVAHDGSLQLTSQNQGLLGSTVVDGKAADVVDVAHFFKRPNEASRAAPAGGGAGRILMVDDSRTLRSLVVPILTAAGYHVTTAADGGEALSRLEGGLACDIVLTDIEMPHVDGYRLATILRADPRYASLPIVALSSRASPEDLERGRQAGFDRHVAKLDRGTLLAAVDEAMKMAASGSAAAVEPDPPGNVRRPVAVGER